MKTSQTFAILALAAGLLPGAPAAAQDEFLGSTHRAPPRPDAAFDLRTAEGAAAVAARWRWRPAQVVPARLGAPDAHGKPTGPLRDTFDLAPRGDDPGLEDAAAWQPLEPAALESRLGPGRLSFVWYALDLLLPERADLAGGSAFLELVVDDYAELRIDGQLATQPGQAGGRAVAGWNAPNRVLLTDALVPGRAVSVRVLAANGPLSATAPNYCWIRSAVLDVYAPGRSAPPLAEGLVLQRFAPELDALLPASPRLERLAGGFQFTEGPAPLPDGGLLFSDPNANAIYRWSPGEGVGLWRSHSGYAGADIGLYRQPGSNGLAFDAEGRLLVCEHGRRRVLRVERNGMSTVLADAFEGRRLNSPNDVSVRGDGTVVFTDPPFGLPAFHDEPRRELEHFGVYAVRDGRTTLLDGTLRGPNGLDFAPDGRTLYVGNWDEVHKVVVRYELGEDLSVRERSILVDLTREPGDEAIDGVKCDERGNVWISGPGGVWIVSPQGEKLGLLRCPEQPANFAWGGADGRTLFLCARTGLYRLETLVRAAGAGGAGP